MTEKNDSLQKYMLIVKIITIGLCGGLVFAFLILFSLYFHFVDLHMDDIVRFFNVKHRLVAYCLFIVVIMFISLIVASIYYVTLKKQNNWLPAAIFGFVLWIILYVFIPFVSLNWNSLSMFSTETHVTTLCIAIMYGTFIGYSISFHYNMYNEHRAKKRSQ